jgi:hypothetical protein
MSAGAVKHAAALAAVVSLSSARAAANQAWGSSWSEVTGELYSRAQVNRTTAIIKSIDRRRDLEGCMVP